MHDQNDTQPAIAQEELVKVEKMTFAYPGTQKIVLNLVSFQIKRGECVALVGTNGSGKTTLARLLAGFYNNYAGKIIIDGTEAALTKNRSRITMMFQFWISHWKSVIHPTKVFCAISNSSMAVLHLNIGKRIKGFCTVGRIWQILLLQSAFLKSS